uniref:Uncharacterized protein n=1 Tax=Glossina palpalis gambiensis TaxID=67801 RepID=A0A1B0AVI1_9MUSC
KIYYHFCKRLVARRIGRCSVGAAKTLFADFRALSEAEVFRNAAAPVLKAVVAVLVAATGEGNIFVKASVVVALKVKPLPEGVGVSFDFVVLPKRFPAEGPLPKANTVFGCEVVLFADKDANVLFSVLESGTDVLLDWFPNANVPVPADVLPKVNGLNDKLLEAPKIVAVGFDAIEPNVVPVLKKLKVLVSALVITGAGEPKEKLFCTTLCCALAVGTTLCAEPKLKLSEDVTVGVNAFALVTSLGGAPKKNVGLESLLGAAIVCELLKTDVVRGALTALLGVALKLKALVVTVAAEGLIPCSVVLLEPKLNGVSGAVLACVLVSTELSAKPIFKFVVAIVVVVVVVGKIGGLLDITSFLSIAALSAELILKPHNFGVVDNIATGVVNAVVVMLSVLKFCCDFIPVNGEVNVGFVEIVVVILAVALFNAELKLKPPSRGIVGSFATSSETFVSIAAVGVLLLTLLLCGVSFIPTSGEVVVVGFFGEVTAAVTIDVATGAVTIDVGIIK